MAKDCKHEWRAIEGVHMVQNGTVETGVVILEICDKCPSARKKMYEIVE